MEAYIGSRPLPNSPAGCCLFVTLLYTCQQPPMTIGRRMVTPKAVGNGKHVITISAKVLGKLEVEFLAAQDVTACEQFFNDIDTAKANGIDLVKVNSPYTDPQLLGNFISLVNTFITNQQMASGQYPTSMFGLHINCWVQSVLEYSGGNLSKKIKGIDITNQMRVPRHYFEQYMPPIFEEVDETAKQSTEASDEDNALMNENETPD